MVDQLQHSQVKVIRRNSDKRHYA